MTWCFSRLTPVAAALALTALTGCAYLHKETPPAVPILELAPAPAPPPLAPLYLTMSQNDPSLPELPMPPVPGAQPAPPPVSVVVDTTKKPARNGRRHGRKGETDVAEHELREHEGRDKDSTPDNSTPAAEGQNVKVTAPTPSGETGAPTPIGQLTAGPTPDTTGSRQKAADLIDSTKRGVDSLHNLNGDQTKTVAQIRSFLDQAERALHNGDIDGAHTLATKAKTLLDELTSPS